MLFVRKLGNYLYCRHVLTPYIEELADNPEKTREFSNRFFDIDPGSKREVDAYNRAKKQKGSLERTGTSMKGISWGLAMKFRGPLLHSGE
jgi:hypothetical protein